MKEAWNIIKDDKAIIKTLRKNFDIDTKTFNEIKKNYQKS